jgi:glycosyltransferase involved in cell wall biosynthesis
MTITQGLEAGCFVDMLSGRHARDAIQMQKEIFDNCQHIFVVSEWCRGSVIADFCQRPEKVSVIHAGINLEDLDPEPAKYHSRNILFVGRAWELKGGPLLLKAFEIVRRAVPDASLTIVGVQPRINCDGVTVLGFLRRDQPEEYELLRQLYRRTNCFVLLSAFETWGHVLVEAQATGTPVVALDRQSRREVVLDKDTGLLVGDRSPEAVAAAIVRILSDPRLACEMGQRGRAFVREHFQWPLVARKVLDKVATGGQDVRAGTH